MGGMLNPDKPTPENRRQRIITAVAIVVLIAAIIAIMAIHNANVG